MADEETKEAKPEAEPETPDGAGAPIFSQKEAEDLVARALEQQKKDYDKQSKRVPRNSDEPQPPPPEFLSSEQRQKLVERIIPDDAPMAGFTRRTLAAVTNADEFIGLLEAYQKDSGGITARALVAEAADRKKSATKETIIKPQSDTLPAPKGIMEMSDEDFQKKIWEPAKRGQRVFQ